MGKNVIINQIEDAVYYLQNNYITCPSDNDKFLYIRLKNLILQVKRLSLSEEFSFEIHVLDDTYTLRRIRISTYQKEARIKSFLCHLPLAMATRLVHFRETPTPSPTQIPTQKTKTQPEIKTEVQPEVLLGKNSLSENEDEPRQSKRRKITNTKIQNDREKIISTKGEKTKEERIDLNQ